jgi:hypothetical protein
MSVMAIAPCAPDYRRPKPTAGMRATIRAVQRRRNEKMNPRAALFAAVSAAAALTACAPDAWKPSPGYDAFLGQVQNACYYQRIGLINVGDMLANPGNSQSGYFIDETSRLYFGKISRENWTSAVTAFIQGRAGDPGVQCVLGELDKARASQVPPPPAR